MDVLKLRTGIEEAEPTIVAVTLSLKALWDEGTPGVLAVYDLVMRCKDSSYSFFGDNQEKLKRLGLIDESGDIHDSIKNVVLASVEGKGMNLKLVSPIAV